MSRCEIVVNTSSWSRVRECKFRAKFAEIWAKFGEFWGKFRGNFGGKLHPPARKLRRSGIFGGPCKTKPQRRVHFLRRKIHLLKGPRRRRDRISRRISPKIGGSIFRESGPRRIPEFPAGKRRISLGRKLFHNFRQTKLEW